MIDRRQTYRQKCVGIDARAILPKTQIIFFRTLRKTVNCQAYCGLIAQNVFDVKFATCGAIMAPLPDNIYCFIIIIIIIIIIILFFSCMHDVCVVILKIRRIKMHISLNLLRTKIRVIASPATWPYAVIDSAHNSSAAWPRSMASLAARLI